MLSSPPLAWAVCATPTPPPHSLAARLSTRFPKGRLSLNHQVIAVRVPVDDLWLPLLRKTRDMPQDGGHQQESLLRPDMRRSMRRSTTSTQCDSHPSRAVAACEENRGSTTTIPNLAKGRLELAQQAPVLPRRGFGGVCSSQFADLARGLVGAGAAEGDAVYGGRGLASVAGVAGGGGPLSARAPSLAFFATQESTETIHPSPGRGQSSACHFAAAHRDADHPKGVRWCTAGMARSLLARVRVRDLCPCNAHARRQQSEKMMRRSIAPHRAYARASSCARSGAPKQQDRASHCAMDCRRPAALEPQGYHEQVHAAMAPEGDAAVARTMLSGHFRVRSALLFRVITCRANRRRRTSPGDARADAKLLCAPTVSPDGVNMRLLDV